MELPGRHRRGRLGHPHHDPVHAAHREPDHLGRLQLHGHRGGRGARLRRNLLAGVRAQLVHRAEGAGHAGGTGGDRGGAVDLMGSDGAKRRGFLTLEELRVAVEAESVDTVLLAFTDMQGRLAGKRLCTRASTSTRSSALLEKGVNYLLAVDVDMNTVDGYAMSSWERGYGDASTRVERATSAATRQHREPPNAVSAARNLYHHRLDALNRHLGAFADAARGTGLTLTAAVALGALGWAVPQVGARFIEMLVSRYRHPIWTKVAAVSLVASGLLLLLGRPPAHSGLPHSLWRGISLESTKSAANCSSRRSSSPIRSLARASSRSSVSRAR